MSWAKHIDMITGKAYKRINILRKLKFILDRKTLEKIYFTFVRPLLEYAALPSHGFLSNRYLESLQFHLGHLQLGIIKLVLSANSCIVDCVSVTMVVYTGKAYKRINILRKLKFILDRKTLEKIYFTFVRPLLEYADVI
jgi:hypothetical protein